MGAIVSALPLEPLQNRQFISLGNFLGSTVASRRRLLRRISMILANIVLRGPGIHFWSKKSLRIESAELSLRRARLWLGAILFFE